MRPITDIKSAFARSDTSVDRFPMASEQLPAAIRRAISELNAELLEALRRAAQSGEVMPLAEECRATLAALSETDLDAVANCGLVLVDVERSIAAQPDAVNEGRALSDQVARAWRESESAQSLLQSVWMVSWFLCQWNERVARILLDLPAQRTQDIARSAPRDWVKLSRASACGPVPRWQQHTLMWRTLLSYGAPTSTNAHQRMVGRGLQLSAGALLVRSAGSVNKLMARKSP